MSRNVSRYLFSFLVAAMCFQACQSWGQSPTAWQREKKADPLHQLQYSQFKLEGVYLVPPRNGGKAPPALVARCQEGRHRYGTGYVNGKFLSGYLFVDAVLDFHSGVPVEFRLDDGKLQAARWSNSTEGSGAFFDYLGFNDLLYGHMLLHKENTNPPVRKITVGVPEYLGGQIQVQFDMPEPTDVADVCGVVVHKK